jgi:hypothetical protein
VRNGGRASSKVVVFHAAVVALVLVAASAVATASVTGDSVDPSAAAAPAAAPAAQAPTATTAPPAPTTTAVSTPDVPADVAALFPPTPVDDGGAESMGYGYGTAQPPFMRATVHYGGSNEPMSTERRELLGDQLVAAREAALEIGTVAEAERQGFVRNFQRVDGRGWDYMNWSRFNDDFDITKPSLLLFADDEPDSPVIAVAYNITRSIEEGPPPDLPLETIGWHYHGGLCEMGDQKVGSIEYDALGYPYAEQIERCHELGATFRRDLSHWMVDLWVVPGWENPWGIISSKHPDLMPTGTSWFGQTEGTEEQFELYCGFAGSPDQAADPAG